MRAAALVLAIALTAACGGPGGAPVPYRLLEEGQAGAFCIDAPEVVATRDRQEWADALERSTACLPDGEAPSFDIEFETELAVAVWWRVAPCLGWTVETVSVRDEGASIVIEAKSHEPEGDACAQALGMLQSFYALDGETVSAAAEIRFVIDGEIVGTSRM